MSMWMGCQSKKLAGIETTQECNELASTAYIVFFFHTMTMVLFIIFVIDGSKFVFMSMSVIVIVRVNFRKDVHHRDVE